MALPFDEQFVAFQSAVAGRYSLERELGRTANKELLPMQPGDVLETFADVEDLMRDTGFAPSTPIEHGVRNFVTWYRDYFKV